MRMSTGIVLLLIVQGLAGCGRPDPLPIPTAPSQVPQTPAPPAPPSAPVELKVFTESGTGFSTSDVRDVEDEIVRFNSADDLIWVANDTRFHEFIAEGNLIAYHHRTEWIFQVRFGTRDGERRAYLTWPDDRLKGPVPTILDLWVDERGDLKIAETTVPVPGT